jgi:hypothetical protein
MEKEKERQEKERMEGAEERKKCDLISKERWGDINGPEELRRKGIKTKRLDDGKKRVKEERLALRKY